VIETLALLVVALQGVAVDQTQFLVEADPSAALLVGFREINNSSAPIVHACRGLCLEIALNIIEIETVVSNEAGQQLIHDLILRRLHWTVPENEAPLLDSMCMQVHIDEATRDPGRCRNKLLLLFMELLDDLLDSEDCRLSDWIWVLVVTVQVLVEGVLPKIASIDTVRIQTWNDFEDEFLSQQSSLLVISIGNVGLEVES
jgi:hypothetical protein